MILYARRKLMAHTSCGNLRMGNYVCNLNLQMLVEIYSIELVPFNNPRHCIEEQRGMRQQLFFTE